MNKINFSEVETPLLSDTIVAVTKDQIYRDLDGEVVILNMKSGIYCGLNEVGASIWQMIQEPTSVKDVLNCLLEQYNVEPERCERELLALLHQMSDNGLIEMKNGKNI